MTIHITVSVHQRSPSCALSHRHRERQVTLKRDLLQHLGIRPGERVDFEKPPGGELRVRTARPTGTIDDFLRSLDGKVKRGKPLSIEGMNRISAASWAGKSDRA